MMWSEYRVTVIKYISGYKLPRNFSKVMMFISALRCLSGHVVLTERKGKKAVCK